MKRIPSKTTNDHLQANLVKWVLSGKMKLLLFNKYFERTPGADDMMRWEEQLMQLIYESTS